MAHLPKLLGVAGPLVAMAGAFFLTLDVVRNLVMWNEFVDWPVKRLNTYTNMHRRAIKLIEEYPPNIPPEEKLKALADENEWFDNQVLKDQERVAQEQLKERKSSYSRAKLGFALIAIGSVMQSAAVLLSKSP